MQEYLRHGDVCGRQGDSKRSRATRSFVRGRCGDRGGRSLGHRARRCFAGYLGRARHYRDRRRINGPRGQQRCRNFQDDDSRRRRGRAGDRIRRRDDGRLSDRHHRDRPWGSGARRDQRQPLGPCRLDRVWRGAAAWRRDRDAARSRTLRHRLRGPSTSHVWPGFGGGQRNGADGGGRHHRARHPFADSDALVRGFWCWSGSSRPALRC